jgi:hypothetical protein
VLEHVESAQIVTSLMYQHCLLTPTLPPFRTKGEKLVRGGKRKRQHLTPTSQVRIVQLQAALARVGDGVAARVQVARAGDVLLTDQKLRQEVLLEMGAHADGAGAPAAGVAVDGGDGGDLAGSKGGGGGEAEGGEEEGGEEHFGWRFGG